MPWFSEHVTPQNLRCLTEGFSCVLLQYVYEGQTWQKEKKKEKKSHLLLCDFHEKPDSSPLSAGDQSHNARFAAAPV